MNDALDPIRHLYRDDAPAETPLPDGSPSVEYTLLAGTKSVLDQMPRQVPDKATLDAVKAAAAAHTLDPLRDVYSDAEGSIPSGVEHALLASTKSLLEAQPRVRPDVAVVEAVLALAAQHTLGPLRHAYGDTEGSRVPDGAQQAEYELLVSTKAVLEAQPRQRPAASVLAAIATAAGATGAAVMAPAAAGARAADRPAQSRGSRRWGAWIGSAAALMIVAVSGLWALQNGPTSDLSLQAAAPSEVQADAERSDTPLTEEEATRPFQEESFAVATPPSVGPTLTPERQAVLGRVEPSVRAAAPPVVRLASPQDGVVGRREQETPALENTSAFEGDLAVAGDDVAGAGLGEAVQTVASWEAGEDVRVLSLRLQQLAASNEGLDWDDPVVPLGATGGAAADPGIRSVRDGVTPSRVEARMRSAAPVRSTGQ